MIWGLWLTAFSTDIQFLKKVGVRDGFRHSFIQASGSVSGLCHLGLALPPDWLEHKWKLIKHSFQGKYVFCLTECSYLLSHAQTSVENINLLVAFPVLVILAPWTHSDGVHWSLWHTFLNSRGHCSQDPQCICESADKNVCTWLWAPLDIVVFWWSTWDKRVHFSDK